MIIRLPVKKRGGSLLTRPSVLVEATSRIAHLSAALLDPKKSEQDV